MPNLTKNDWDDDSFDWSSLDWGTDENGPDAVELTQSEYDDMVIPVRHLPTSPFRK